MTDDEVPRFTSHDWSRTSRGDLALVSCDRDRPRSGTYGGLVGAKVKIDGAFYVVRSAEARSLGGATIKTGEPMTLLVSPHFDAQMPNTGQTGTA